MALDVASVYEAHWSLVVTYFLRHLKADPAVAEDLASATFERVVKAAGRYQPHPDGPKPWIMTIAHRVLIDHVRSRRDHLALKPEFVTIARRDAGSDRHADILDARQMLMLVTTEQALVLRRCVMDGYLERELAQDLGCHRTAITKRKERALIQLRKLAMAS